MWLVLRSSVFLSKPLENPHNPFLKMQQEQHHESRQRVVLLLFFTALHHGITLSLFRFVTADTNCGEPFNNWVVFYVFYVFFTLMHRWTATMPPRLGIVFHRCAIVLVIWVVINSLVFFLYVLKNCGECPLRKLSVWMIVDGTLSAFLHVQVVSEVENRTY